MAGFCPRCGRPLPDSGVCSCAQEAPITRTAIPHYTTASLSRALSNLPSLFSGYFKDPIAASRLAIERRDHASGILMMLLTVFLSFLSTLFFTLRYASGRFSRVAMEWAVTGIFAPLLALAITFGLLYVLTSMAGIRMDLRSVLALMGLNLALPLTLMLLSMVLSLVHMTLFQLCTVLLFAAWAVSFFLMAVQVLGIRLTLPVCLVTVVGMTAGYYAVSLLRDWLVLALS